MKKPVIRRADLGTPHEEPMARRLCTVAADLDGDLEHQSTAHLRKIGGSW